MRIDGVIPREDFEWLADTVNLFGRERACLYLRAVEGAPIDRIARMQDITERQAEEALTAARFAIAGHEWPEGRRAELRMLLEVIAGPTPSAPHTPHHAKNEYTGELQQVQIRGKRVTVDDLM